MALVACPECGKQVSTEARTCPHCGSPTPLAAKWAQFRIVTGVVLLVLAIIIWQWVWNSGLLRELLPGLFR